MTKKILKDINDDGVVTLRLNRPEAHNAIDDDTIDELSATLAHLNNDTAVRVVVVRGTGDSFCSGIDIAWMQHMARSGTADDARRVVHLLLALRNLHKPTIAVLEGTCVGGGVAVAACCDIALASEEASFSLPAVHLGTVPAVIAPFVIEAIGVVQARRYLLTGEEFSADKAREIGLVHAICMKAQMDDMLQGFIDNLCKGGPRALADTKDMLNRYANKPIGPSLIEDMAQRVVDSRKSEEAREGLAAFLEKRAPAWRNQS